MLTLYHNNEQIVLEQTEYYVRELASGLDEVIFNISIWDPNYALMQEEENIVDRGGQRYLIKQIDAGAVTAKIVCQLDLDEWRASMAVGYNSGTKTVSQQINAVKPAGWTVLDRSGISIGRTISGDYTPLQVCERCRDVYGVYIRWDNNAKKVTIYSQAMGSPVGSFASRELNLKEINYKGKSQNFATRLYAYGKDGLSFADINDGKAYVDNNTYSSRVICAYWSDDRYTDKASLKADAEAKLAKIAVPERSYDCSIVDLQATDPAKYNNLDFSLFTTATLIDDIKETAIDYMVVERHVWPYHPEQNDVIFNSAPVKIQNSVVQIEDEITNPNSTFQQLQAARIAEATKWLTSGDGYLVIVQDDDGNFKELLCMDTNDVATAADVLRINKNGIGFSHTGVNGPYVSAWTIDGSFNADFILAGEINANLITAGTLSGDRISGGTIEGTEIINKRYLGTDEEIIKFSESGLSQYIKYGGVEKPAVMVNATGVDVFSSSYNGTTDLRSVSLSPETDGFVSLTGWGNGSSYGKLLIKAAIYVPDNGTRKQALTGDIGFTNDQGQQGTLKVVNGIIIDVT